MQNDTPRFGPSFWRRAILFVIATLLLIFVGGLLVRTASVLMSLFIAALFAVVLRSLANWLHHHTPLGGRVSFAVVIVGLLALVVGLVYFLGPRIVSQGTELADDLPESLSKIETQLEQFSWGRQIIDNMPTMTDLNGILVGDSGIISRLTGIFSVTLEVFSSVIILVFTGIYFAAEPGMYVDGFVALFPIERRDRVREILRQCYKMMQMWLFTRFISMIVISVITFIGLMILGTPFAMTLVIIAAVGAFIPVFGPILALIPAVLIAFLQSPEQAVYVTLLYLGAQSVDNYFVSPLLQRYTLYLPPALIIASQLVMVFLVGRIGLAVAAPLIAVVVVIVRMAYVEDVLGDQTKPLVE